MRVLAGPFLLVVLAAACHRAEATTNAAVAPVDTTSLRLIFKDTALVAASASKARTFDLRAPGQRDALRAALRKQRDRWNARSTRDYRFLLRVGCFCPGPLGWLLMEVRNGQPVRARDRTGKAAAVGQWNTFSIDGLFDNLERSLDRNAVVKIAFDPRWHFPAYVYTLALPGPDMWGIVEARALRP